MAISDQTTLPAATSVTDSIAPPRQGWVIYLLPLVTLGLAYYVFVPMPLANDDICMEMLARGIGMTSHSTPFLFHMHVWLGYVLVWLYELTIAVPWYRLLFIATHVASSLTIAYVVTRQPLTTRRWCLVLTFFVAFDLHFYIRPSFVITASLAAEAAALLWLDALRMDRSMGPLRLMAILGLFLVSCLIRCQATFMVVGAAAIPLLGMTVARRSEVGKGAAYLRFLCAKLLLPLGLALVLILASRQINIWTYATSPGWEDNFEFNRLRSEFTDYHRVPYSPLTVGIFQSVGWSLNDFRMLDQWFYENEQLYNIQNFQKILADYEKLRAEARLEVRPTWSGALPVVRAVLDNFWTDPMSRLMAAGGLLPLLIMFPHRRSPILFFTFAGILLMISALILYFQRMPPWVYGPLLAWIPLCGLVLPSTEYAPANRRPWLAPVATIIVLALAAISLSQLYAESMNAKQMSAGLRRAIQDLHPNPSKLYVIWGGDFPFELILSGSDLESLRDFKMLATGGSTHSPINRERLREFHINDLCRAMIERPDVFTIVNAGHVDYFLRYATERLRKRVAVKPIIMPTLGLWHTFDSNCHGMTTYTWSLPVFKFVEMQPPKRR